MRLRSCAQPAPLVDPLPAEDTSAGAARLTPASRYLAVGNCQGTLTDGSVTEVSAGLAPALWVREESLLHDDAASAKEASSPEHLGSVEVGYAALATGLGCVLVIRLLPSGVSSAFAAVGTSVQHHTSTGTWLVRFGPVVSTPAISGFGIALAALLAGLDGALVNRTRMTA